MSKIAFMFPGQGAQTAGMGKDFYEHSEIARNIIDRSSGLLKLDMKSLCFEENENLHQTEYTQAALVTVCMAMEQVLRYIRCEAGCNGRVESGRILCHCFGRRDADRGCDPGSSKERHFDAERRSGWKRRDGCGTWPGCRKD